MTNPAYTPPPFPCSIVVVQTTGQLGKTFKFEKKDWCVLGANKDCDIIVPFSGVAPLQALIHVKRNGVFLQGIDKQLPVRHPRLQKQLLNEEEVLLLPGDIFFLGERKFLIEYNAENATVETFSDIVSHVQGSNESTAASKNPRTATPRSSRAQRRRRKSSLVVGEFDEKFVSRKTGSEKLLSKTQLARLSNSASDIRPPCESNCDRSDGNSASQLVTSEYHPHGAQDLSDSSSTDESTVISDLQDRVSRNIDFSTIEDGLLNHQLNGKQPTAPSDSCKKVSSRERRDIVFARLSKGLSATPRRGERTAIIGRHDTIVQNVSGYSSFAKPNILTGKENVPQLCSELPKSFKDGNQDANKVRSPLSNREGMENQKVLGSSQVNTPGHKTRLLNAGTEKFSVQTPRGRSVAFASNIELAAGAHYSPFRPRPVLNQRKSTPKSKKESQSGKLIDSAGTSKVQSHFSVGLSHHNQEQTLSTKSWEQGPAPTSSLDRSGNSFYSHRASKDASQSSTQPVLEYEDDSDPPTPSSTDEGPQSHTLQIPGPSPMARVGGALAAFLSRLSGTLDSEDENDSSPAADEASSYKMARFSKSQEKSRKQSFHSTEPVMSASEMKELSSAISPGRRTAFVSQVESAAADMRKAMQPFSDESSDKPPCPSREKVGIGATRDVLVKVEDGSTDAAISVEQLAEACGSDLKGPMTSQDESIVQQIASSTRSSDATACEELAFNEGDSSASENPPWVTGETPSDPENKEQVRNRSTSLEEYRYPRTGDSVDLEIDQIFLSRANNFNHTDLRSEQSEGDEIDYGDEEDEASMESSDREIAAVVIDGDEEHVLEVLNRSDSGSHDDSYSSEDGNKRGSCREAQSHELEELGELKDTAEEPENPQFMPIQGSSDAGSEPREREEASVSTKDDTREIVESSTTSDTPAKTQIRSEIEEVTEVAIVEKTVNVEGDMSKTNQGAVPGEAMMQEDKLTQISTVRKELVRLKKDELKARLVARGVDATGLKKELVERLALHITEETNPVGKDKFEETSSTPLRQRIKKKDPAITTTSASPHTDETPSVPQAPPNSGEDDSNAQETRSMVRRSARKKRTKSLVIIDLETPSPADKPQLIPEPQTEDEDDAGVDLSSYRKRTVKELRQFLKNRGLDIQQKMRKEELIQHLVSLSIGSNGSPIVKESETPAVVEGSKLQRGEAEPASSAAVKSLQRMTVMQLRSQLKNRGQCQAGTKKTLLERLSSKSERRTRSGRVVDATACSLCQTGKVCDANGKR